MDITIRQERQGDLPAILDMVEKAFENVEESDPQEQHLVERLHDSDTFIPELSLVAVNGEGIVVGYILLTKVKIVSADSTTVSLAVAPLAVHPDFQNNKIGGMLIEEAHKTARAMGYGSAVLLGHKDYYTRFGYQKAIDYCIRFPFDAPQECCMVIELLPDALSGVSGTIHYPECMRENTKELNMQPNPDTIFPVKGCETVTYVKPTVKNPNIIVGEFTYFSDTDFEKHVLHHYDFNGDRLIIGKFCQIASGVTFIMNGANHQMNAASTYPFYIMEGWTETPPTTEELPLKGDTIVGNDVWIGQNATILPGVHIGDGAIIGLGSIVGHDVEPYTIILQELSESVLTMS